MRTIQGAFVALTFGALANPVTSKGIRPDGCQKPCTRELMPHCGSDGVTYDNLCLFEIAKCMDPNLYLADMGTPCPRGMSGGGPSVAGLRPQRDGGSGGVLGGGRSPSGDGLGLGGRREEVGGSGLGGGLRSNRIGGRVADNGSGTEMQPNWAPSAEGALCPSGCKTWFDGCSTCQCARDGPIMTCTLDDCVMRGAPECVAVWEDEVSGLQEGGEAMVTQCPVGCQVWSDGCNTCKCAEGVPTLCTLKICPNPAEPKCLDGEYA